MSSGCLGGFGVDFVFYILVEPQLFLCNKMGKKGEKTLIIMICVGY